MVRRSGARPGAGRGRRRLQFDQGGDRSRPARRDRPAPMRCSWSRPITTSRRRTASMPHYKAINDAIGIPIIIYNIPGRSVVDMSVDTMQRLYELKNIAGVKDATANMARVIAATCGDGRGFQSAVGRGYYRARIHGAWRPWLHLGDVECGAAAVRRIPGGVPARRLCRGARNCRTSSRRCTSICSSRPARRRSNMRCR